MADLPVAPCIFSYEIDFLFLTGELKRMEILQEKLCATETKRNELQTQLDEIEEERDEEIKIIQDVSC